MQKEKNRSAWKTIKYLKNYMKNMAWIVGWETKTGKGYHIFDLIDSLKGEYGFEKIAYLLLFGNYPDAKEEEAFFQVLSEARELPQNFTRDVLMKAPSKDIMNSMTRSVLTLASYDKRKEFNTL